MIQRREHRILRSYVLVRFLRLQFFVCRHVFVLLPRFRFLGVLLFVVEEALLVDILIGVSEGAFDALRALASQTEGQVTPGDAAASLVEEWASRRREQEQEERARPRCMVPDCRDFRASCGLCQKHYMRVRYYLLKGFLDRGWLIRHGRLLGEDRSNVVEETLATLPRRTKNLAISPDLRWLFGWPESYRERDRLERAQRQSDA